MRPDVNVSDNKSFQLNNLSIIEEAYERIGIPSIDITPDHIYSAMRSLNLLFTQLDTKRISWRSEPFNVPTADLSVSPKKLHTGQNALDADGEVIIDHSRPQISLGSDFVMVGSVALQQNPNSYAPIILTQIGEDASLHQPTNPAGLQNPLFTYYIDWHSPDNGGVASLVIIGDIKGAYPTGELQMIVVRRIRGAGNEANTPDFPPIWLECICAGLAMKLFEKWGSGAMGKMSSLEKSYMTARKDAYAATANTQPLQVRYQGGR